MCFDSEKLGSSSHMSLTCICSWHSELWFPEVFLLCVFNALLLGARRSQACNINFLILYLMHKDFSRFPESLNGIFWLFTILQWATLFWNCSKICRLKFLQTGEPLPISTSEKWADALFIQISIKKWEYRLCQGCCLHTESCYWPVDN